MSKISIEVGHGGKDVGAVTKDGKVFEKDINLNVALELKRQLERHGHAILISRETDRDDLAKDFYSKAKVWKPDLHISVHTNAFNGTAKGFEIFISQIESHKAKSKALCQKIEEQVKVLGQTSRGIKNSSFLLSSLPCVSAYCELGFMDNPDDYKQYDTVSEQKKFGTAYAKGVIGYLGETWKDEVTNTVNTTPTTSSTSKNNINTVYRVIAGSYSVKDNAEKHAMELQKNGVECFVAVYKL